MPFCCLRAAPVSNIPTHEELEAMTKAQLLEFASEYGIDGLSNSMLKADIIAAIEEALAA